MQCDVIFDSIKWHFPDGMMPFVLIFFHTVQREWRKAEEEAKSTTEIRQCGQMSIFLQRQSATEAEDFSCWRCCITEIDLISP